MRKPKSIREVLERAVERDPDKIYLLFEDKKISYIQLDAQSNRAANAFLRLGINKGDRVALMLPNCPEYLYLWFGLNKIGASMVPVNTYFRENETRYILQNSESKIVLASPEFQPIISAVVKDCPDIRHKIFTGNEAHGGLSYASFMESTDETLPYFDIDLKDEASILYTSGTTGNPKGCIESQEYYLVAGYRYSTHLGLTSEDRVLTPLPIFHMNPQILSTMGTLFVGGSLALVDRFHPSSWWQELREKEITFFHYLGVMPAMLMGQPPRPEDADHPLWIGVGAGVPATIHEAFEKRFNCMLLEVFGMTESGLNFCCRADAERKVGTASFCKPFPEYEARVVDENDHDVPPGVVGELVLRGSDEKDRRRGFMSGYYKNPTATKEVWRNDWFHTGDYVKKDEDGYYFFVDRKKDIVRRSGENISASEVEGAIRLHDAVMDAAVIPVPDPIREQEVKAYVILKKGFSSETVLNELINWCIKNLAYFKVPRYWEFRESFPVTKTGKIQKQVLKSEKPDLTVGSYDRVKGMWISSVVDKEAVNV